MYNYGYDRSTKPCDEIKLFIIIKKSPQSDYELVMIRFYDDEMYGTYVCT